MLDVFFPLLKVGRVLKRVLNLATLLQNFDALKLLGVDFVGVRVLLAKLYHLFLFGRMHFVFGIYIFHWQCFIQVNAIMLDIVIQFNVFNLQILHNFECLSHGAAAQATSSVGRSDLKIRILVQI